jgi:uncharacterized protein YcfJ
MLVILLFLLLLPGVVLAQSRPVDENITFGYAQVLRASPVYETYRVRTPEQRCDGQVYRDGGDPTGGTVIGAVVGGALGNQVGKGDGRKASTIAGAVIGGVIGHRVDKNNGSAGSRCRTVDVERDERRLIGYDVEYQYKGEKYMSRLDQDPGNRLRVRVAVVPDFSAAGYR